MSRRPLRIALLCAALLASAPGAAHARGPVSVEPPAAPLAPAAAPPAGAGLPVRPAAAVAPRPAEARPRVRSYGWQTAVSDLAALSLLGAAWAAQDETFVYASLGVYALGAPAVHVANGQPGKAGASLALRVGVPTATFVAAYGASKLLCERDGGSDTLGEGLGQAVCILFVFGLVTPAAFLLPSAIDAERLARKEVRPGPALSVVPTLMPARQGAMVGLGGTF